MLMARQTCFGVAICKHQLSGAFLALFSSSWAVPFLTILIVSFQWITGVYYQDVQYMGTDHVPKHVPSHALKKYPYAAGAEHKIFHSG